jgi:hypothetical protein
VTPTFPVSLFVIPQWYGMAMEYNAASPINANKKNAKLSVQYTVYGTLSCVFERNSGKNTNGRYSWKIPILLYSGCTYRGLSTGTVPTSLEDNFQIN